MAAPPFREALLTGASSGLGRAIAVELGRRGVFVHLIARREDELERAREEIRAAGADASVHPGDVTDGPWLDRVVAEISTRPDVDLVVAGAGVAESGAGADTRIGRTHTVLEVNLVAAARTLEAALPAMRDRGRGTLAAVTSLAGMRGLPTAAAYCASKGGLSTWLESLRGELHGTELRVCDVRPGFVRTPLTARNRFPMPFLMEPEEAARRTIDGLERGRAIIEYPRRLAWPMRAAARLLPHALWRRVTSP